MNNTTKPIIRLKLYILLASILGLTACSQERPENVASHTDATPSHLGILLEEAPVGAIPINAIRTNPQPGREVVLDGRIGGRLDPFTEGYAMFVLTGEAVEFCDEMGDDDHCATPWDACCEDPETIAAHRASIQIPGEHGLPLPQSLKGVGGLAENDRVIVTGTIAPESDADNLIINATGIYRM